jgi:hypothetical protein
LHWSSPLQCKAILSNILLKNTLPFLHFLLQIIYLRTRFQKIANPLCQMANNYNCFEIFTRRFLLILAFILPTSHLFAGDPDNDTLRAQTPSVEKVEPKSEKFNAGELIIDHISDSHEWHIAGHIAVPLPVIIYSSRGLSVFLSSHLEDGTRGFKYEKLKDGSHKMIALGPNGEEDEAVTSTVWDLSITKNVLSIFVTMALMLWIFLSTAKAYKRSPGVAPKGLQSFVEAKRNMHVTCRSCLPFSFSSGSAICLA